MLHGLARIVVMDPVRLIPRLLLYHQPILVGLCGWRKSCLSLILDELRAQLLDDPVDSLSAYL